MVKQEINKTIHFLSLIHVLRLQKSCREIKYEKDMKGKMIRDDPYLRSALRRAWRAAVRAEWLATLTAVTMQASILNVMVPIVLPSALAPPHARTPTRIDIYSLRVNLHWFSV